jgi:hypothetical protein
MLSEYGKKMILKDIIFRNFFISPYQILQSITGREHQHDRENASKTAMQGVNQQRVKMILALLNT